MKNVATNYLSSIQLLPVKPNNGLLGFASFLLNGSFYVGNIAIHSRPDGNLRLVFPEKTLPNGKVISIFHPITAFAGQLVLTEVSKKYNQITGAKDNGNNS